MKSLKREAPFQRLWRRLPLLPAQSLETEWLDVGNYSAETLAGNLTDLRRVNQWLGGISLTTRALGRLLADRQDFNHLTALDVASGDAYIASQLTIWGKRRHLSVRVLALDINPEVLGPISQEATDVLGCAVADARRLPLADSSIDVAMCSLALHHFGTEDAIAMLREMGRVARLGIIVNDLVRNWNGYLGAWLLSRLLTSNAMTRHDAPLSVRRAYTRKEMASLATRAELQPISFYGFLGYRTAMVARNN